MLLMEEGGAWTEMAWGGVIDGFMAFAAREIPDNLCLFRFVVFSSSLVLAVCVLWCA